MVIAMMTEAIGLGGAEIVVLQLCEELQSRGHTVHPVVPGGREGWLLTRFEERGIVWHPYDLRRPVDPGMPKRTARLLRDLHVDVVHSHEFTMAVYGAAAARRAGVPHVVTMHGNEKTTEKWQRRMALRWALGQSDHAIAVSRDTRRHLESTLRLAPGSVGVVLNGIPEQRGDRDRVRRELGVEAGELLVLAVGSLTPRKGHAVLIRALASVAEAFSWKLAIAGRGPERDALEAAALSAGLTDRIHLLGPRNDVADLQAAADIFVMPSLWEGLPLALLEAMFAGNAIIASGISGIPEAIEDGVEGLLCEPGDVDGLAARLTLLMDDAQLRQRIGEAAQKRARTSFTIRAMADSYELLYRSALAASRSSR